jgi:hypothetical protein
VWRVSTSPKPVSLLEVLAEQAEVDAAVRAAAAPPPVDDPALPWGTSTVPASGVVDFAAIQVLV